MIKLENLSVGYEKNLLIEDANCQIENGRLTALIGRNGAGKSTLLRTLAGLSMPVSGKVILEGKDIALISPTDKAKLIAFVTTERIRIANLRCRDVVALGRSPYTNWIGRISHEDEEIVMRSLELVGMESYADRDMNKMSDGECQRIMIARALAQDTPVLFLDEPTSFLDMPNRYETCMLLANLAHNGNKCVLFSTHELDIAMQICDDISLIDSPHFYVMSAEEMINSGHIERLFSNSSVYFNPLSRLICRKDKGLD